jgi:hypothetical protein
MTQLAALNIKISGDSSDLQSDIAKARAQLNDFEASAGAATKRTSGFTGSLGKLGTVSGQTRAQIQNASFQLQDIAVQLQSGTRASTVFAQQLPQLLGGFGALGAVAGVLAGVGIPALAFAFSALSDETEGVNEALDGISDRVSTVDGALKVIEMSASELTETFGGLASAAREASLAIIENEVELARRELAGLSVELGNAADQYAILGKENSARNRQIRKELGLTKDEHRELTDAIETMQAAQGITSQVEAAQDLRLIMEQLGISTEELSSEFLLAESNLNQAQLKAAEFEQKLINAEIAAKNVNEELAKFPVTFGDPNALVGLPSNMLLPPGKDKPKRKGRAKADPLKGELERLQERLMTEEELELASFERRQEILQQALERKLLTQQEYNELMEDAQAQHSDRMAQLDVYRYGTVLDQTGAFLGAMASAFQNGNDKMLRIAKVFGAAEALINSYRAYNQVIADPSLPWYAKIPAAVSVLGAGLNMVNAIKGVSSSGSAGAAGGAVGASGAAAQSAPQTSRNVAISLTGGDMFSRDQVIQLINGINEAVEDGAVVRLV